MNLYVIAISPTLSTAMRKLHIANTFFEWELETEPKMSLSEAFTQHAIFRQLQFLPAIYAKAEEGMVVADRAPTHYWNLLLSQGIHAPKHFTFEQNNFSPYEAIESWGASQLIAKWADRHGLIYPIPDWKLVKQVNSKQFSFENSPKLPKATLLDSEKQAKYWMESFPGKKVLKTCFGVSGKGHLLIDAFSETAAAFLKREWDKHLPVIAEPWVERVLDFSTQWSIDQERQITYIGATICNNDERGRYRFNLVGNEQGLFQKHQMYLSEHKHVVVKLLQAIADAGFFGNIGFDAMLYQNGEEICLHPVVEINARKTMGWAALQFQRHYFPNCILCFQYATGHAGLLPEYVEPKRGKQVRFLRNLYCDRSSIAFTIKSHPS